MDGIVDFEDVGAILGSREVWVSRPRRAPPAPPAVERLCWHCCHGFEGRALRFPVRYDDRRRTFKVVGQFCSWACVKAYNRDRYSNLRASLNAASIRHYMKRCTGRTDVVRGAPPREALRAFGGPMSIADFRRHGQDCQSDDRSDDRDDRGADPSYHVVPLPLYFLGPCVAAVDGPGVAAGGDARKQPTKKTRAVVPDGPLDFGDVTTTGGGGGDTLRLRRPKPLAVGHITLERALGLNSLIR